MIFNVSCPVEVYFGLQSNNVLLKCSTHVGPHILRIPGVQLLALPSVSPPRPLGAIHRLDWHICRFETARNWQFHIQLCSRQQILSRGVTRHPGTSPCLPWGGFLQGLEICNVNLLSALPISWNLFFRGLLKSATRNCSLGMVQLS